MYILQGVSWEVWRERYDFHFYTRLDFAYGHGLNRSVLLKNTDRKTTVSPGGQKNSYYKMNCRSCCTQTYVEM
jgi:hypothetical protein